MTAQRYSFQGREYDAAALVEGLIRRGYAAPAARDMDVDELIRAIVDQCFLDGRDAPTKFKTYTEVALQARRNQNTRRERRLQETSNH